MFKLIHINKGYSSYNLVQSPKTIEMTLDSQEATTTELCEFFSDFLKACTFHFDGTVQIVENDEGQSISSNELAEEFADLNLETEFNETPTNTETASQTEFDFQQAVENTEQ